MRPRWLSLRGAWRSAASFDVSGSAVRAPTARTTSNGSPNVGVQHIGQLSLMFTATIPCVGHSLTCHRSVIVFNPGLVPLLTIGERGPDAPTPARFSGDRDPGLDLLARLDVTDL